MDFDACDSPTVEELVTLYRSAGYHDAATLKNVPLHAFVQIKDVDLS